MHTSNFSHVAFLAIAFLTLVSSGFINQAFAQHGGWLNGDFNQDGLRDDADIDLMTNSGNLSMGYRTATTPSKRMFDMNFDGEVNTEDVACWLELGAVRWDSKTKTFVFYPPTVMGDTDLDGVVEKEDELILVHSESRQLMHPLTQYPSRFSEGDFNGDGSYDNKDWLIWFGAIHARIGPIDD